jgi:uncharacterized repeat protein (TIGR03803 family)
VQLPGTTEFGGNTTGLCGGSNAGCGTVYSVSLSGAEHMLHAFTGGSDGMFPTAALTDVNGTLYGTTVSGGSSNDGVVFSISTSGAEHVLYSFTGGSDGSRPSTNLIYANGLLYGTTAQGGVCGYSSDGCGTVFSISTSGKETVIYRFTGGADDGATPVSGLIEVNGTFYGTTLLWGDVRYCDCGTVYSITKSGKEKMMLRAASIGARPAAALVDVDGTMYGTTTGDVPGLSEAGTDALPRLLRLTRTRPRDREAVFAFRCMLHVQRGRGASESLASGLSKGQLRQVAWFHDPGRIVDRAPQLLYRLRSAENYFDHAVWLREHRHVTRIKFGRLGFHAFRKKAFKIRVDGVILLSDDVPTRLGLPGNARRIVREDVGSRRALCRPHELLLSRREVAAKIR